MPTQSIVTPAKATERVNQAAKTLADYLGRMSGGQFKVETGDGTSGIAIGLSGGFAKLPSIGKANDPTTSEDYLLRSHKGGIYVIGASEQAVEHAIWDLLYRLGHRQFFPGETWEIVPKTADLAIAVNRLEHPSYHSRRIWYGFGAWDYNARPYADWCARNRATGGIVLHTGHAYDGIVARNKAEFAAHSEYKGLVGGERKGNQFCISNPNLRKLVVEDALRQFVAKPDAQSISLEPADGGGWCECDKCRAMGKVSDRALTLANDVAETLTKKYDDKFVGMYAYSEHSPPPSIQVHPRVVISVATAFVRGGYTVDQLLTGWSKQGATLGIREYYSVNTWDRDLPGAARGSNLDYLKKTIPHFHSLGARFLSAESSDNWGCNGLGYYLASRLMWDVNEAKRTDDLVADFLDKAFGPAKEPMAGFYRLIDGSKKPLLSDDLIGRMYRYLADAKKRTDDPAIHRRLHDLTLYTRYVERFFDYSTAKSEERQRAFEELIKHTYRMRRTMMVHAKALYRDLPARDKSLTVPKEAAWSVPEGKNPWKNSAPFTASELDGILSAGIAKRQLLDFEPVAFSSNLVPATKLKLPSVKDGSMGLYSRGLRTYCTWIDKEPANIGLKVQGGRIYTGRGTVKLDLYPAAETEGKAVAHAEAAPDKEEHAVLLKTTFPGLHRIEVKDAGAGTTVSWAEGQPMTVCSSPADAAGFHGRWSLYFYVPKGTKVVGGFTSGVGTLLDGDGKKIYTFDNKPGYFSVPVPSSQDGKLWKFQQCAGQRLLMTVPPYLARNSRELLLPAEVVERDSGDECKGDLSSWKKGVKIAPVSPNDRHSIHAYFNTCPESPDGRFVLYYASVTPTGHDGELRILERATGIDRVLARDVVVEDAHRAACQQWTCGGRKVVFHNLLKSGEWVVMAVDVGTGRERILARNRQVGFGQPHGAVVPICGLHWNPGSYRDMELVNVETGEISKTAVTAEAVRKGYPAWVSRQFGEGAVSIYIPMLSPDLRRVFFKLATSGGGDFRSPQASKREGLLCYDLKHSQFLFQHDKWGHPAWHPDSRHIINVPGVIIDSTTGKSLPILNYPKLPGSHPSFSPDGKLFTSDSLAAAVDGQVRRWAVGVGSVATGEFVSVLTFDNSKGARSWRVSHPHPVFSADGARLYFNVSADEWSRLYVAEAGR